MLNPRHIACPSECACYRSPPFLLLKQRSPKQGNLEIMALPRRGMLENDRDFPSPRVVFPGRYRESEEINCKVKASLRRPLKRDQLHLWFNAALLHKSAEGRSSPFPGQTYPVTSVMGVPSAVKPLRTATRTWNSAT